MKAWSVAVLSNFSHITRTHFSTLGYGKCFPAWTSYGRFPLVYNLSVNQIKCYDNAWRSIWYGLDGLYVWLTIEWVMVGILVTFAKFSGLGTGSRLTTTSTQHNSCPQVHVCQPSFVYCTNPPAIPKTRLSTSQGNSLYPDPIEDPTKNYKKIDWRIWFGCTVHGNTSRYTRVYAGPT